MLLMFDIKTVAETIMEKGTTTEGTYEKVFVDEKARVAKLTVKYGVFSTVQRFT